MSIVMSEITTKKNIMKATTCVTLRKNYKRVDNSLTVCLRLTINRRSMFYSLNIAVQECDFDKRKQRVKTNAINSYNKNLIIESTKQRADKIILDYAIKQEHLTILDFEKLFKIDVNQNKNMSFYQFAEKELIRRVDFAKSNKIKYNVLLRKLKQFKSSLTFDDINYNFLNSYVFYLQTVHKNKQNTVCKEIKLIKALYNEVQKQGLVDENKRLTYSIGWEETEIVYLEENEIKRISDLLTKEKINSKLKNVITYFLFACFTGLRYGDIIKLQIANVREDFEAIMLVNEKTGKNQILHLIEPAKKILNSCLINKGINDKIFKTYSNQKTNDYLKDICKIAKVNKNISFHKARHTFATLCLSNEVPIETVSNQLNHSSIKMTQVYAHLTNEKIKKDFKVMDKLFKRIVLKVPPAPKGRLGFSLPATRNSAG